MTMTTRENAGVTVSSPDIVVLNSTSPPPAAPTSPPGRSSSRRRAAMIIAALVAVAGIALVVAALLDGDEQAVATPVAQVPADAPGAPEPLVVRAEGPASATVGEPVEFRVTYSDGSGTFSGTSEDWGDGVGTSSLREGQCTAADVAPDALSDSYRLSHTWTEPGTYTVTLGVHSYACKGTTAVQDQATQTLTLQVLAR